MATLEASLSIFSLHPSSSSSKLLCSHRPPSSLSVCSSGSTPFICLKYPFYPLPLRYSNPNTKFSFERCFAVQEIEVDTKPEQTQEPNQKRKLFVLNLPWSLSVEDIKKLLGECGTVTDVEIIKNKDGRSRGFAFITMSSGEEAEAVVQKFDSYELSGRIIRVEFARRFKKPSPPPPLAAPPAGETRHKLYVSNLAWKVRSTHLREFLSSCNPVSVRVVFDSPSGRSGGYGFASFATKEEAEAALSAMDGKELMGRPVRLKFSVKTIDGNGDEKERGDISEGQPKEA